MKYYSKYPDNKLSKITYNPHEEEEKILEFWTKQKAAEKVQEFLRKENNGLFIIHNGPPFPTGSPHSGHIVNFLIKDIITRYAHQKNLQVESEFGWDCHGLAVEHEVDKKLEIKEPQDLYRIGVSKYNDECRKFVQRHEGDWKQNFDRIGIWIDFTRTYSTMSPEYMEGMWKLFKQLFERGLVHKDTKVLPYSTGCFTHLSHFEAKNNWKHKNEVAAIVSLEVKESDVKLLIWTDSPWKLAANFTICVNPNSRYVKVKMLATGQNFIVSKKRLAHVFPNPSDYSVVEEILGKHLKNLEYQPLFDYLAGSFTILQDDSINDEEGTGIVALCPHFDQNEYRICLENGLSPDKALCPIDSCGRFNQSIAELAGLTIEEASVFVVQEMQKRGQLVHLENVERSKQHCWRSDVSLIHKVTSTWFLKVDEIKTKLKNSNSQVTWNPTYNKEIFENHCEELSDWPVGRYRHWGTPIPIWSSASGDEIRCIGSVQELLELTGAGGGGVKDLSDLHKEFLDKLVIPSRVPGNPPLRRVPEVFDCWFESGALPLIQQRSQAHVIVEGQDQMNGWFLTTSVLSAALSLPPPSKAIVAHGLVLGPDGTKLSKRKHNHNDAIRMAEKYGADALRIYLTSTPLMTGESFALQENEVRKITENVMQPLYKIVYDSLPYFGKPGWVSYGIATETTFIKNIFEQWILSRTESLVQFYDNELKEYRFHLVIPRLVELLDEFHNWFIPAMRISNNASIAEFVMFNVVFKACLVLAPFAPFFTEHIYQIIKPFHCLLGKDFVHTLRLTEKSDKIVQPELELKIARWQSVVEMVREARRNHMIPIEYRISELIVVHPLETYLDDTEILNETLMKMVNIHHVTRTSDRGQFGACLKAKLKTESSLHKTMNVDKVEEITQVISKLSDNEVEELIRVGSQDILEQYVSLNDVEISYSFEKELDEKSVVISRDGVLIVVRMNKNLGYYEEGTRLEIISVVQKLRKKAKVYPSENLTVCYLTKDTCIERAFERYSEELRKTTNSNIKSINDACDANEEEILQETVDVKGAPVILYLFKERQSLQ